MTQPANTVELIRGPTPSDQSYVASTWVRSLMRRGSSYDRREADPLVTLVNAVLDRTDTRILIRHAPTNPHEIRGWVAYAAIPRATVVHWAYVRKEFRERGYATSLLQAAGCTARSVFVYTTLPAGQAGRRLITCYPGASHVPMEEFLR